MDCRLRFIAVLQRRGYLAADGLTIYGEPVWRAIAPGHEPQALMDATVAALIFLEVAFPPIPSEVVLPLSGFLTIGNALLQVADQVGRVTDIVKYASISALAVAAIWWIFRRVGI